MCVLDKAENPVKTSRLKINMIETILILIFGAICFIAGILLDKEKFSKEIKDKMAYTIGTKKKIDVFEPDEMAQDKKEQQELEEKIKQL